MLFPRFALNPLAFRSGAAATATLALVLFAAALSAADTNCPYHKIKWSDFKGAAPTNQEDAEICGGTIPVWEAWPTNSYKQGTKWKCDLTNVSVVAFMDKTGSGARANAQTDSLLQHEQYHLDIYQYWAREMEKALKGVMGEGADADAAADDALAKAEMVAREMVRKCDELQEQYDNETDHSRKEDKQKEWCKKIGDLLNPPPPKDNKSSSQNSRFHFDPNQRQFFVDNTFLGSFVHNNQPLTDPYLQGATVLFPPLVFEGYHMEVMLPLAIAPETSATFAILAQGGSQVAAHGTLHVLCGDGTNTSFTGWIEELKISPGALAQSPFLQQVEASRRTGQAVFTVDVQSSIPLDLATANWTQSATVPVVVTLGTTLCDPAMPSITRQPVDQTVAPGETATLSVFVAAAGPFTYQWRRSGDPIPGAIHDTLTINGAQPQHAGLYDVVVTSPCGSTVSARAALRVGNAPIPTLSEWGLILLAVLMVAVGAVRLRASFRGARVVSMQ